MYQVRAYNRRDNLPIMESETFDSLFEAEQMLHAIGKGENYYSIIYKLESVSSGLDRRGNLPLSPFITTGG
jgi:hypothetical protein